MPFELTAALQAGTLPQALCGRSEEELVTAAKAGEADAFAELFHRLAGKVYRVAKRLTETVEEAEDVVQESFLKAFLNISAFRGDSLLSTWVTRIAVNEALMKVRRRRYSPVSLDASTDGFDSPREVKSNERNPEEHLVSKELRNAMIAAIRRLEPGLRVVFELRDVEQLSTEETAQALGLSTSAVKSRLLRARLKLQTILTPHLKQRRHPAKPPYALPNAGGLSMIGQLSAATTVLLQGAGNC